MTAKKILAALTFTKKQQCAFLQDIASLINDGINLKESILMLESISTGAAKKAAIAISTALAKGQTISTGLSQWFPPAVTEIIRAGESAGTLAKSLQCAADAIEEHTSILSTLVSTITYPSIVLVLSLVLLVTIKNTVLNNFIAIKALHFWPSQGIALYHLATFIEDWWWALLFLFFLMMMLIYKFLTSYTGNLRWQLDNLPLITLYRDSIAAQFMQTTGLLISNGIVLKKALNIMSSDAPPYLAWHLINMEYRLSGGIDNIAEVLDTNLLRKEDLNRLKVVTQGKNFATALLSLANHARKRNKKIITLLMRLLGALLLILSAVIAANLIFGIYSIGSNLV